MPSAERVRAILGDESFNEVVAAYKASLVRKVMAASTSPEERETALAHHWAVDGVLAALRAAAQEGSRS
jgi:hypothetical protein